MAETEVVRYTRAAMKIFSTGKRHVDASDIGSEIYGRKPTKRELEGIQLCLKRVKSRLLNVIDVLVVGTTDHYDDNDPPETDEEAAWATAGCRRGGKMTGILLVWPGNGGQAMLGARIEHGVISGAGSVRENLDNAIQGLEEGKLNRADVQQIGREFTRGLEKSERVREALGAGPSPDALNLPRKGKPPALPPGS